MNATSPIWRAAILFFNLSKWTVQASHIMFGHIPGRTEVMQRPINSTPHLSHDPCRALVVEDEPLLRTALCRILRAEGHLVHEAAGGPDALTAVRREHFDVVIIDGMLPGMPGEFVRRAMIRELGEHAPEVVMLATTLAEQKRYEKSGVLTLCKPFRVEHLIQLVEAFRPKQDEVARHSDVYELDEVSGVRPSPALVHALSAWNRSASG